MKQGREESQRKGKMRGKICSLLSQDLLSFFFGAPDSRITTNLFINSDLVLEIPRAKAMVEVMNNINQLEMSFGSLMKVLFQNQV